MTSLSESAAVRRLADRFGFGLGGDQLAAAQAAGFDATLNAYLAMAGTDAGAAATPVPNLPHLPQPLAKDGKQDQAALMAWRERLGQQQQLMVPWWLDRMVRAHHQLRERLTWFWHGHFATGLQKVVWPTMMLRQNEVLRRYALGDFAVLARSMVVDPAMLLWLDGNSNVVGSPNENLAREFLELFVLGHGNYTESDVKEVARALTGWVVDVRTGTVRFVPGRHDPGTKSILGRSAAYGASSLVDVVVAQPASARFVVGRLWFRLISPTPPDEPTMQRLLEAYGPGRNIAAVLRAIAAEAAFVDRATTLVKQPVEWLVGLLRALGMTSTQLADVPGLAVSVLARMGQIPFRPPSVGGWTAGAGWLTTGGGLARLQTAVALAQRSPLLATVQRAPARWRVDQIRYLLGVDAFTARTVDAINHVIDRPAIAIGTAACSPEYVVSG